MDNNSKNGWTEWGKHVLKELDRQNNNIEALRKEIGELKVDFGILKTKMTVFSGLVGGGASLLILLVKHLIAG